MNSENNWLAFVGDNHTCWSGDCGTEKFVCGLNMLSVYVTVYVTVTKQRSSLSADRLTKE